MSKIVGDTQCPSCAEKGRDKTGNHLMLFEDSGAYCNRCGHVDNWKDKDIKPKPRKEVSDEELKEIVDEFLSCKTEAWPKRKLKKSTTQRYNCRVGCSPTDKSAIGSYLFPHYSSDGKIVGYQVRLAEEKRFFNMGRPKQAVFFGQHLLPKGNIKKLYVCESPTDAMSLYQAIKEAWELAGGTLAKAEPNVIGLPHGTGCAVDIAAETKLFDRCEEVILVFDSDKAGDEAATKLSSLYKNIKTVKLPMKDPNEMLQAGKSSELAKLAQFSAGVVKLDCMSNIEDLVDDICEPVVVGPSYPWPTMTRLTHGQREQQIIGVAAGVGMGKTSFKYALVAHDAITHGRHSTVFDLESNVRTTGKRLASIIEGKDFNNPTVEYSKDTIRSAVDKLKGMVTVYNHKGGRDWNDIKSYIRHSVVVNGSSVVHLDPITAMVAHLSSTEANDMLNTMFSDLSAMTQELNFSVVYYSHLNPPKQGQSHERGGKVLESQMTGSRAMMKWSTDIWGIEGNKDPDLADHERNVRKVVLLKNRDFGNVGSFYLFYDPETTRLAERFV